MRSGWPDSGPPVRPTGHPVRPTGHSGQLARDEGRGKTWLVWFGTRSALPVGMTPTNQFELAHRNHPLFMTTKAVYRSLHAFKCPRSAATKLRSLDRAATQLLIHVGEAIDLPSMQAPRLSAARDCIVRLNLVLDILLLDSAIEPSEYERLLAELGVCARALEAHSRPTSEPASPNDGGAPGSVAPVSTAIPAETRAPDAALESSHPEPQSGASGEPPETQLQPANDNLGTTEAPDPLGRTSLG
jgi:hypothetical protein